MKTQFLIISLLLITPLSIRAMENWSRERPNIFEEVIRRWEQRQRNPFTYQEHPVCPGYRDLLLIRASTFYNAISPEKLAAELTRKLKWLQINRSVNN